MEFHFAIRTYPIYYFRHMLTRLKVIQLCPRPLCAASIQKHQLEDIHNLWRVMFRRFRPIFLLIP